MTRVFVLSSGSIFGRGVEKLLARGTELEVVGSGVDLPSCVEHIKELGPDVLILDKDRWPGELPPELVCLLEQTESIRIVGVNLRNNTICSYRKEMREITALEDLVEVMR